MYKDWSCTFQQMKLVREGIGFNVRPNHNYRRSNNREERSETYHKAKEFNKKDEKVRKDGVADEIKDEETPITRRKGIGLPGFLVKVLGNHEFIFSFSSLGRDLSNILHGVVVFRVEKNQDLHELVYENQNSLLAVFFRKGNSSTSIYQHIQR